MHWTRFALAIVTIALAFGAPPARAGDIEVDGSFVSTVAPGTAPLAVSSTTKVDNLNADLLDGLDSSDLFTTADDGSGSGLDADLLDGFDSSAFARALGNVVRVGKTGGDFGSIQAALGSITTASAANPFLVLVGPGVYDERVVMKPFVDIQGSGEGVTRITQAGSTSPDLGTVAGADDAELRFLTVDNSGGSAGVIGLYNDGVSPSLVHVTVLASVDGATAFGVRNRNGAAPSLARLTVRVTSTGSGAGAFGVLSDTGSSLTLVDSSVEVSSGASLALGVDTADASSRMRDVDVRVGSSGGGLLYGVANEVGSTVEMHDVRIEAVATTSTFAAALFNSSSTVRMFGGSASASGASTDNLGVWNESNGDPRLHGVSVTATGGSNTTLGVNNFEAPVVLRGCTVAVSGGTGALLGILATGNEDTPTFTLDIHSSELSGGTAISADDDYTVRVGASQLVGGVIGAASYTCVHAYDGGFGALGTACT